MTDAMDAIAKAKAIAAKLNASLGGADVGVGMAKRRWDAGANTDVPRKKRKVYIPRDNPEFNYISLLIGPRGSTQKRLEESTGARLVIRGRGSEKDGDPHSQNPDDHDELHASIEGSEEAVDMAARQIEAIINDPAEAMRLKQQQLRDLAEMKGVTDRDVGGGGGGGHYGPSGGGGRPRPGLGFGGGDGHYGPSGGGGGGAKGDEEHEVMKVPQTSVGFIIGRGGENVSRMQRESGCSIQIAKEHEQEPGDPMRNINLRGSRAAIDDCRRLIQESIDQRQRENERDREPRRSDGPSYGLAAQVTVMVPNDRVGVVIGRAGNTIKSIQDRTGTEIKIPRAEENNDPNFRAVHINATSMDAAQEAEREIIAIMNDERRERDRPSGARYGDTALIMHVRNEKCGLIIGKGGATIKEIQNSTGTRIQIPPEVEPGSHPPYRVVSITGPRDGPDRARYEIESIIMSEHSRSGSYTPYEPSPAFQVPVASVSAYQTPSTASAYNPYAAYGAAYADPYAAYYQYGAYAQQQPPAVTAEAQPGQPQEQQPSSPSKAADGNTPALDASGNVDLAYYHKQFWEYAAVYGEKVAREAYGEYYSPPQGTPVPEGIKLPTEEEIQANLAAARGQAEEITADPNANANGVEASGTTNGGTGEAPPPPDSQ